ncbi:MAG: GAF domain-containing protein [Deltaproteobacteria bacterium]|nr:GAF domain-containing protein [Deltaproteobacteria bacterium]
MSKTSGHILSMVQKFIILFLFLSSIFVFDSWLLLGKTKGMEPYDEVYHHLNVLTADIVKLEYVLDISIITKNFTFTDKRGQTVGTDLSNIDRSIDAIKGPEVGEIFDARSQFFDIRNLMLDEWRTVKGELGRLNTAKSEEEMLLIHNTVDMNTFILSDNADKLTEVVKREKTVALKAGRDSTLLALALSLVAALGGGLVFFVSVLLPVNKVFSSIRSASGAGAGARVRDNLPGEAGDIARGINAVLDGMEESRSKAEKRGRETLAALDGMTRKIETLNVVTSMVGRSLSQYEVSMRAMTEVFAAIGADAGAVYLREGEGLKLKVSKGFSGTFFYRGEDIPIPERPAAGAAGERPLVFADINDYPDGRFKTLLVSEGVKSLVCVPIVHDESLTGFFDVAFRETREISEADLLFLQAISSNMRVAAVYSDVFCKEHAERIFLERILQQSPLALAVFDISGVCVLANGAFKKQMGYDTRSNFVGNYRVFDDEEFERQGLTQAIKKSYEGHVVEFIADYRRRAAGDARSVRLKVKTAPLYDAGGNIPNIVMIVDSTNHTREFSSGGRLQ